MAGILALLAVVATVAYFGADVAGTKEAGAPADPAGVPDGEPVARVAAQVAPSVVQVNVQAVQMTPFGAQEGEGLGSGVIYREDGYILTNNHVVEGASEVNIAFADGTTEQGEVVGTDPATDVAVVRVDRRGLPAASFGDARDLTVGELAVAIGSPSGFQSTVTSGVVSGMGREVPAELTGGRQETSLVDLIQTDAAISPGSSGGALANRNGEVVGINVAYLPPAETGAESIGFAIPAYTATSVADQLIENGEAVGPYMGVSLTDLAPETARRFGVEAESGALVAEVEPSGPAARAGIEAGDIVTAVGEQEVRGSGDLLSALRRYVPGDRVEVTVLRDGAEERINLRLGERTG
jgi:S1-C subfamily serine protease